MAQDQVFSIQIVGLNHSGEGVGRKDGRVVFVPYAAPGDLARVRVVEERRGFARAELLSLEKESPDRVLPPCPLYLQCGGCQLQHISYDAQLAYKKRRVEQALRRIGKLEGVPVGDCLPAPRTFHYRNKARFSYSACLPPGRAARVSQQQAPCDGSLGAGELSVGDPGKPCGTRGIRDPRDVGETRSAGDAWGGRGGRGGHGGHNGCNCRCADDARSGFVSGFYGRRTHDVVDLNECLIQSDTNNKVFQALNALVTERAIPVYGDGILDEGILKHLVVRCAGDGEQALAVLVGSGGPLRDVDQVALDLMARVPELVGVVEETEDVVSAASGTSTPGLSRGVGPGRDARPRSWGHASPTVVRGTGLLREHILGLEFVVSAESFLQVNPEGMEVLYREALRAAGLSGDEVVLDAYCGVGTISLLLARECRHVYGIEAVCAAVADARRNAGLNRLENCTFIAGRAEDVLSGRSGRPPGRPGRTAYAGGERDRQAVRAVLGVGGGTAGNLGYEETKRDEHAPSRGWEAGWETSALTRCVDVVVLDPPRAGCGGHALHAVAHLEPDRTVYVSCDPETLARDLALLARAGYRTASVQPVDMFPQTAHTEAVALLLRSSLD